MNEFDNLIDSLPEKVQRITVRGSEREIPSKVYDIIQIKFSKAPMKPLILEKKLVNNNEDIRLLMEGREPHERLEVSKDEASFLTKVTNTFHVAAELPCKIPKSIKEFNKLTNKFAKKVYSEVLHPSLKKQTWFFRVNLPAGVNFKEFCSLESYFASAVGGTCQIKQAGNAVYMTVSNIGFPKVVPYDFDSLDYIKDHYLPIYLGISLEGPIILDLTELISILIIGLRGYGKSNILHSIAHSLLRLNKGHWDKPRVEVIMIDPKPNREFEYMEKYGAYWSNRDSTIETFKQLDELNTKRGNKIAKAGVKDFLNYLEAGHTDLPWIVIIIDEMADLDDKDLVYYIDKQLRMYRSQGFCVIGATQRPSADVWEKKGSFSKVKSQFEGRLTFHVADQINASMGIDGSIKAASIPAIKGRAVFSQQTGHEVDVQTPYYPNGSKKDRDKLQDLLDMLDQLPQPFDGPRGEVWEDEHREQQKGLLPRLQGTRPRRQIKMR